MRPKEQNYGLRFEADEPGDTPNAIGNSCTANCQKRPTEQRRPKEQNHGSQDKEVKPKSKKSTQEVKEVKPNMTSCFSCCPTKHSRQTFAR